VAQVVEHLLCKCKVLSLNPNPTQKANHHWLMPVTLAQWLTPVMRLRLGGSQFEASLGKKVCKTPSEPIGRHG
jgi:hypothetical protein